MCSYNAVNGVPACLDDHAQNGWLRAERGFQGLVVSDCDSIGDACVRACSLRACVRYQYVRFGQRCKFCGNFRSTV